MRGDSIFARAICLLPLSTNPYAASYRVAQRFAWLCRKSCVKACFCRPATRRCYYALRGDEAKATPRKSPCVTVRGNGEREDGKRDMAAGRQARHFRNNLTLIRINERCNKQFSRLNQFNTISQESAERSVALQRLSEAHSSRLEPIENKMKRTAFQRVRCVTGGFAVRSR